MTCDLSTSRYLKPTWAQEKNTKTLKPWLRWDQQSSLRFACKKARLPGKASLQLNIVISLKEERLCVLAVVYSCLTRSLLVKDPDFHLFSMVVGTSILRHNTTFLSSWEELNRGLVTGIKTITYIGWLSSAAPSTFSSTDQREIGTSTGCCSLIFFGLCPWTRSIYPTYTQQLLELCRPQLSYRNSCKTWLNTMKSLLIHINYPNVLLLKSSPAMPPWSFQGRPWVNFCAAIGACPGRSLSALPRPGFDHGYTICCTIWGFPKIGGTQKWMVYKGHYY